MWQQGDRGGAHGRAVGSSLQANLTITAPADHALLAALGEDLRFVTITSAVKLALGDGSTLAVTPSSAIRSASAAGTGATTSADAAHRRSAAAAPATCSARAKRARWPDGMAWRRRPAVPRSLLPWLGIALAVILLDQFTKTLISATSSSATAPVTSFFNVVRVHNTGRPSPSSPGRAGSAGSSSAWARRRRIHRLDAAQPRRRACLLGAGADPRRRARQRGRPAAARPRDRLHPAALRRLVLPRRSTSPTARSPSARRCWGKRGTRNSNNLSTQH